MFRAEIRQLTIGPTLKMEGRLIGDWAVQAKSLITTDSVPEMLIVDLTDVTYVDSVGEQVLKWFRSIGAAFMAKGIYAAGVCERLHLPLFDQAPGPPRQRATDRKAHRTPRGS